MEREILAVPIYRCPIEKHSREMDEAKDRYLAFYRNNGHEDFIERMSMLFFQEKWFSWKFNEIVGWLEIRLNRSKLTGELWYVKNRVSKSLRAKLFERKGKVFELFLSNVRDEDKTRSMVLESIKQWYETSDIMINRYIDVEEVSFKVSIISWSEAISLLTKPSSGRSR